MIKLKNVSKSFGEKRVLDSFSYDFPENSVVCISGASGCGKTTLLRIIASLEKADSGEVNVSGTLSFLFQENRLLPWLDTYENIACVLSGSQKEKQSEVLRLLSLVGLENSIREPIQNLSGGMKRRVAFARAIAASPDILLLDEPFTGLDDETKKKLYECIKEYAQKHLVVLVTHDGADISSLANQVINL